MPKTVDAAPSAARRCVLLPDAAASAAAHAQKHKLTAGHAIHRHVDHRPDGPSRRPSSATGLPPMVKSPSLSASSVDHSSNSSGPPHVPPSPPEHGGAHYQRMSYQDEQLVARYAPPHQGGRENGAPPSSYGGHQYGPPPPQQQQQQQQQRYGYYTSSPQQHYNGGPPPPPPPASTDPSRNGYAAPPAANGAAPFQIVHTDDAATKLSDRVRRRCFNCCTTETSTWRRSSLNPGKVVRKWPGPQSESRMLMFCDRSYATSVASSSAPTRGHALSSSHTNGVPWRAAHRRRRSPRLRRGRPRPQQTRPLRLLHRRAEQPRTFLRPRRIITITRRWRRCDREQSRSTSRRRALKRTRPSNRCSTRPTRRVRRYPA
jgi:hypothetical protein